MGEERDRDIVFSFGDEKALRAQACRRFEHLAAEAIGDHGRFTVALAGGSSPKPLYSALARSESVDWDNVVLVPGEERMVSTTNSYSNTQTFRKTLLDHLEKQPRYVAPPTSLFSAYEAARKWEEQLRMEFSNESSVDELARFDLVLLDLGADGHTASLFPSDKALLVRERWCAPTARRGNPNVERVTLTLPILSNGRETWFIVTGESKTEVFRRVISQRNRAPDYNALPASLIRPVGPVRWFTAGFVKEADPLKRSEP